MTTATAGIVVLAALVAVVTIGVAEIIARFIGWLA